jgi:hypothetical protein
MPIQLQGLSGLVPEVDATFDALRVSHRPLEFNGLGHYRLCMATGTIGAALAANSELVQFRWTHATNLAVVMKILISAGANVAASAAALVTLEAMIARAWTVAGTGGATATLTGNNQKVRTSGMGTVSLGEFRIATTAALTAGTKTLDSQGIGNVTIGIGTGAITTSHRLQLIDKIDLLEVDADGSLHPPVFAQNEGFVIKNGATAWPAAMTWALGVTVIWAEVTAY